MAATVQIVEKNGAGGTPASAGVFVSEAPKIDRLEGRTEADNGLVRLAALDGARVFKRKAIKGVGTPESRGVVWLVAELEGVRVYIDGDRIVVTKQDLYP